MADRLHQTLEALAAELGKRGRAKSWAPGKHNGWLIYDSASGESSPVPQLGHGGPGTRDLWLYTEEPIDRGLVVRATDHGMVWQVDDGRGLVESGTARRPSELVDRAWSPIAERLVDPADVLLEILNRAASRDLYRQLGSPTMAGHTLSWGHGWQHDPLHVVLYPQVCGGHLPSTFPRARFPYIEHRIGGRLAVTFARQLVSAADLGRRMAGAMLDYVQQVLEHRPRRGKTHPAFCALDQTSLAMEINWRPDGPPAALRDAGKVRRKSKVDGQWSDRLDDMLEDESPTKRSRRVKRAQERLAAGAHLPKAADNAIDTKTGKVKSGWGYGEGADRIPFNMRNVAALYLLGLGARAASTVLVGDARAKNAIHRRMKEIAAGGEHWRAIDTGELLAQMGLDEHVRPDEEPGGAAGRDEAVQAYLEGLSEGAQSLCRTLSGAQTDSGSQHVWVTINPSWVDEVTANLPFPRPFDVRWNGGVRQWLWVGLEAYGGLPPFVAELLQRLDAEAAVGGRWSRVIKEIKRPDQGHDYGEPRKLQLKPWPKSGDVEVWVMGQSLYFPIVDDAAKVAADIASAVDQHMQEAGARVTGWEAIADLPKSKRPKYFLAVKQGDELVIHTFAKAATRDQAIKAVGEADKLSGRLDRQKEPLAFFDQLVGLKRAKTARVDNTEGLAVPKASGRVRVKRRSCSAVDTAQADAAALTDHEKAIEALREQLTTQTLQFLDMLERRGVLTIDEVMDLLDLSTPKVVGGMTGSISRWASLRGLQVPYEASMHHGQRRWLWRGYGKKEMAWHTGERA